jgi:5-methylcytosine-specific restriction endonuclease McrA
MKEQILELRRAGKSYKEICSLLNCSRKVVSSHCSQERIQWDRSIRDKTEDFQRERLGKKGKGKRDLTFRWKDVIEKFGWETTCYLTGRKINLKEPKTYQFDHIVSISKGGSNTIDNLGICCRNANQAKHDMSVEEFLNLCKEILEHNGHVVEKK